MAWTERTSRGPDLAYSLINFGVALFELGRFTEAMAADECPLLGKLVLEPATRHYACDPCQVDHGLLRYRRAAVAAVVLSSSPIWAQVSSWSRASWTAWGRSCSAGTGRPGTPGTHPPAAPRPRATSAPERSREQTRLESPACTAGSLHHRRLDPSRMVLPVIQGERGGVIAGERAHDVNGPARRSRVGPGVQGVGGMLSLSR
jgi:hypothetical protein